MKHTKFLWGLVITNTVISFLFVSLGVFTMFNPGPDYYEELREYVGEEVKSMHEYVDKEVNRQNDYVNKEVSDVYDFVNSK